MAGKQQMQPHVRVKGKTQGIAGHVAQPEWLRSCWSCFCGKQPRFMETQGLNKMSLAFTQTCSVAHVSEVSDTTAHNERQEAGIALIPQCTSSGTTEIRLADEPFMENELGRIIN